MPRKYYATNEAEEHGASTSFEMANPCQIRKQLWRYVVKLTVNPGRLGRSVALIMMVLYY